MDEKSGRLSATWVELVETSIEIQDFSPGVGRSGIDTALTGRLDRPTA